MSMDARKNHVTRPCMHICTCEACTQRLLEQGAESCPVCRGPIEGMERGVHLVSSLHGFT